MTTLIRLIGLLAQNAGEALARVSRWSVNYQLRHQDADQGPPARNYLDDDEWADPS